MVVHTILYHPKFVKEFKRLSVTEQQQAIKTETLFRRDPLHPSLRLHAFKDRLVGSWSLSVTLSVRILFKRMENGDIVFYSIGRHDIYRSF